MLKSIVVLILLAASSLAHAQGTVSWHPAAIATANTAKDGSSGTVAQVIQATDTTYVDRLVCRAVGTNIQTVMRVFINNGGPTTVAANNVLFAEKTLAATTLSETTALADESLDLNIYLPKDHRIFVTIGTTVASGWRVTAVCKSPNTVAE